MEILLETELCYNKQEVDFANGLGITEIPSSHLFVIENCRKKERRNLTEDFVELVQGDIVGLKNQYPEKKVLGLVQFKKGMTKTDTQIEMAIKCSIFDGSDGACLYEKNPLQNVESLKADLPNLLKITKGHERNFVIEMDGEDVLEKVNLVLHNKVKNFILVAGDHNNETLWRQVIVSSILANNGKAIVLLPARMNTRTGKSFIEKVETYGATIVIHGMPFGGGKTTEAKFLDKTDMFYKRASLLPVTHSLKTDSTFSDLFDTHQGIKQKQYELSRVCSLTEGRLFCEANRRTIVV